jgi:hypothetical protein
LERKVRRQKFEAGQSVRTRIHTTGEGRVVTKPTNNKAQLHYRIAAFLSAHLFVVVAGILTLVLHDRLVRAAVKAYDSMSVDLRPAVLVFGTIALAVLAVTVKRTNLFAYAMVELLCGAFILRMAWDRVAGERSYATIAAVLAAAYFFTRALDNLISGWDEFFQRLQDVSDLVFWDIKDDLKDSKE